MKPPIAKIFGLSIFAGTKDQFFHLLANHLDRSQPTWLVATPNPEQVVLTLESPTFKKYLNRFDWQIPDGIGLVKAASWLYRRKRIDRPLKERITGVEVVSWLLKQAKVNNLRVLVIGGRGYGGKELLTLPSWQEKDGIGQLKVVDVGQLKPSEVVGFSEQKSIDHIFWLEGYQDKYHPTKKEETVLIKVVKKLKPNVVLVAFGAPVQEKWLVDHRLLLDKVGVSLGLTIGGAMDMILGLVPRAPALLQTMGLEWLWRLVLEPWRWRRQLKLLKFIWLVIRY